MYYRYKTDRHSEPFPAFINLRDYLHPPLGAPAPGLWDPTLQWQQDSVAIYDSLRRAQPKTAVFIIDGIDEYSPALESVERQVIGLVDQWPGQKYLVIGQGSNYLGDNPFFRRDFPFIPPPAARITLKAVRTSSEAALPTIERFLEILPETLRVCTADQILQRALQFRWVWLF